MCFKAEYMREHVHLCEYACVCAAICMQTFIHQGTVLQYFSTMLCQCYFIPRSIVISSDANQPYRSIRLPDVHLEPGVRFESLDAQANHAQALCWVRLQIVDAWSVKFHSNQALAYKKKKNCRPCLLDPGIKTVMIWRTQNTLLAGIS